MYFTDSELMELKIALLDRLNRLSDMEMTNYRRIWTEKGLDLYDRIDAEYQQRKENRKVQQQ